MTVSSSPATVFVGSLFTLICSIELLEDVASGVSLQVMWTGPGGSTPTGTQNGAGASFTSTIFGTAAETSDGGNYICSASVISNGGFLISSTTITGSIAIVVGNVFINLRCM